MEFWLKEGVDGFNVDSVNLLMEDFTLNRGNKEKNKVNKFFSVTVHICTVLWEGGGGAGLFS